MAFSGFSPVNQEVAADQVDFASSCQAGAAQSVASNLPIKVVVKQIANGPKWPSGTHFVAATDSVPAFCQVTGSFVTNPQTGKTANFMATFPANWNGKYLQLGCSGNCGQFFVSDPAQPTITVTNQGRPFDTIRKGYATFATDEGHEGMAAGTWAIKGPGRVDEEAIEDFYYRADKVLAGMGKAFTAGFYSRVKGGQQSIARSYFNGCSGGGRDAFVAASYFPEEFDGIIGGSAADVPGATMQIAGIAVASLRSQAAYVPPKLLDTIAPIVKAQCDGLDGVKDGLIQNPAACNFRPERDLPKCTGGADGGGQCFTAAQIETVSTMLTAVTDEHGNVVQPGYSVSELQAATFATPKRPADLNARDPFPGSDNGSLAGGYWPLADANLRVFAHKNDPAFFTRDLFTFKSGGPGRITDFHTVVSKAQVDFIRRASRMGTGHIPENLERFVRQDRKFLIWHNFSDQVLTPYMSVNYYKQLARLHGGYAKLQRNVRMFALPGTPHCSMGGAGPNTFDALSAMENWVEKGIAPDALPATNYSANAMGLKEFGKAPGRSMPLCKFPEMARYRGTGDVNLAANWSCSSKDKRMLWVGESGRRAGVLE